MEKQDVIGPFRSCLHDPEGLVRTLGDLAADLAGPERECTFPRLFGFGVPFSGWRAFIVE